MAMKNLPTLKGVFPQPKAPPKRDFLRENKLKLKDLQKNNANSKKHLQNDNDNLSDDKHFYRNKKLSRRTTSSEDPRRINSGCSCSSKKTQSTIIRSTKQNSRIVHCDKSIQTDEINDENFLSDALKRCFSKDDNDLPFRQNSNIDLSEKFPSSERIHHRYNSVGNLIQNNHDHEGNYIPPDSAAFNIDLKNLLSDDEHLPTNPTVQNIQQHQEQVKKKQHKIIGAPDLGNRSDLRLPKYLEKEKRERELHRIREMEKDPHCPVGHHVLDDKDRQEALKTAEKRFQDLVNELNRMPMSSETLRIRNRKAEIEKALIELENNIRTFSKSKVYVKSEN